jgi:hypothetical protein
MGPIAAKCGAHHDRPIEVCHIGSASVYLYLWETNEDIFLPCNVIAETVEYIERQCHKQGGRSNFRRGLRRDIEANRMN